MVCNESVMSRRGAGRPALKSAGGAAAGPPGLEWAELGGTRRDGTGKGRAAAALVQEHQRGCTRPRRRTTQRRRNIGLT